MSETKGPFDAAIDTLRFCLIPGDLRKHTEKMIRWPSQERAKQAKTAIRVLEAAGKVDKLTALPCFDCAWEYCFAPFACDIDNTGGICRGSKEVIRALLEALPDKEK